MAHAGREHATVIQPALGTIAEYFVACILAPVFVAKGAVKLAEGTHCVFLAFSPIGTRGDRLGTPFG